MILSPSQPSPAVPENSRNRPTATKVHKTMVQLFDMSRRGIVVKGVMSCDRGEMP